jgi:hypothetical protein
VVSMPSAKFLSMLRGNLVAALGVHPARVRVSLRNGSHVVARLVTLGSGSESGGDAGLPHHNDANVPLAPTKIFRCQKITFRSAPGAPTSAPVPAPTPTGVCSPPCGACGSQAWWVTHVQSLV